MNKLKYLTLTITFLMVAIFVAPLLANVQAASPADEDLYSTTAVSGMPFSDMVDTLEWQYKANIPHAVYQMGIATGANNNVYLFGGNDYTCTPLTMLQIYNPATDKWMYGTSMPTGRWGSGAAVGPDGNIYVIGGRGVGCGTQSLATVEMYRPSQGVWETRSPMTSRPRSTSMPIRLRTR